ncbi:hypothetical protein RI367_007245 [Sorochytrium milnesiophthora]
MAPEDSDTEEVILPIAELNRRAHLSLDMSKDIKLYLRSAETLYKQGNMYHGEGSLQKAYELYMRYSLLVLEELPKLPGYNSAQHKVQVSFAKKNCSEALGKLEMLKPVLEKKYAAQQRRQASEAPPPPSPPPERDTQQQSEPVEPIVTRAAPQPPPVAALTKKPSPPVSPKPQRPLQRFSQPATAPKPASPLSRSSSSLSALDRLDSASNETRASTDEIGDSPSLSHKHSLRSVSEVKASSLGSLSTKPAAPVFQGMVDPTDFYRSNTDLGKPADAPPRRVSMPVPVRAAVDTVANQLAASNLNDRPSSPGDALDSYDAAFAFPAAQEMADAGLSRVERTSVNGVEMEVPLDLSTYTLQRSSAANPASAANHDAPHETAWKEQLDRFETLFPEIAATFSRSSSIANRLNEVDPTVKTAANKGKRASIDVLLTTSALDVPERTSSAPVPKASAPMLVDMPRPQSFHEAIGAVKTTKSYPSTTTAPQQPTSYQAPPTTQSPVYSANARPTEPYDQQTVPSSAQVAPPPVPRKPHAVAGPEQQRSGTSTRPRQQAQRILGRLENGEPLRTLYVPQDVLRNFEMVARPNTERNLETCGILCGTMWRGELYMTHLIIPKQISTSDTCATENEEELFEYQDKHNLITLGWIHTHPTQTCFMSSVDLHTHCSYQVMLSEAIAIVLSPRHTPRYGVFRLTHPPGLNFIMNCPDKNSFHPHPDDIELYTIADYKAARGRAIGGHVVFVDEGKGKVKVVDLRPVR